MIRVIAAAVVGGIIMFAWGAAAHMVTPLGHMGLSTLPDEAKTLAALKETIPQAGLYFAPGFPMDREPTEQEKEEWLAKMKAGPSALVLFEPAGEEPMMPEQLISEFVSNALAALLAAIIAVNLAGSYSLRVILLTLIGVAGWLSISASYWIWYGFPQDFTLAEGIMQTVGWLASALAIAAIVRRKGPSPAMG